MAWLRHLPPSARHPRDRWQVRYRDDASQERSAGIYPTQAAANAVKRRLDRGESIQSIRGLAEETGDQDKALMLFGDYVTTTWWPRWRDSHPHSAYLYGKRIEKRILPAFGNLRFVGLDADMIGDWKAKMIAEQLGRPSEDGAVAAPWRLRVVGARSDPGTAGRLRVKGPKTEASKRTIARDQ